MSSSESESESSYESSSESCYEEEEEENCVEDIRSIPDWNDENSEQLVENHRLSTEPLLNNENLNIIPDFRCNINCIGYKNCNNCTNCIGCINCLRCFNCTYCIGLQDSKDVIGVCIIKNVFIPILYNEKSDLYNVWKTMCFIDKYAKEQKDVIRLLLATKNINFDPIKIFSDEESCRQYEQLYNNSESTNATNENRFSNTFTFIYDIAENIQSQIANNNTHENNNANCINCINCVECINCINCVGCYRCYNLENCINMRYVLMCDKYTNIMSYYLTPEMIISGIKSDPVIEKRGLSIIDKKTNKEVTINFNSNEELSISEWLFLCKEVINIRDNLIFNHNDDDEFRLLNENLKFGFITNSSNIEENSLLLKDMCFSFKRQELLYEDEEDPEFKVFSVNNFNIVVVSDDMVFCGKDFDTKRDQNGAKLFDIKMTNNNIITIFKFDDKCSRRDYFDIDKISNIKYIEIPQTESVYSIYKKNTELPG